MNPIFWDILSEKQTYKIGYFISSVCILVVIVCWDRLLGYYCNSKLLPRLKYIFVKSCIVSFMALCFDITAVTRTICFFPLTVFSRFVSFIISWEAFFLEIIADTMSLARISVHWWDEVFVQSFSLFSCSGISMRLPVTNHYTNTNKRSRLQVFLFIWSINSIYEA